MIRSRPLHVFVAVLAMAALLAFVLPISQAIYWPIVVFIATLIASGASGASTRQGDRHSTSAPSGSFLCDRCKYNDVRYCSRPERPNATHCDEFKPQ